MLTRCKNHLKLVFGMKRTQVQLDEATYELLRRRAYERGVSMASLVRESLSEYLVAGASSSNSFDDFRFIGIGRSDQGNLAPISERHDEALE